MAEVRTVRSRMCPYFTYSSCRNGVLCQYYHVEQQREIRNVVCGFFLNGKCKFYDKCWFKHAVPGDEVSSIFQSANARPTFVPSIIMQNLNSLFLSSQRIEVGLCPYFIDGVCPSRDCTYIHGELCELCGKYCLYPFDDRQRNLHSDFCRRQRDLEKKCGICREYVLEENQVQSLFGILENCDHVFCLPCIKEWRKRTSRQRNHSTRFENPRACPECRVKSDFYMPSHNWVDSGEEKEKLIADYKASLSGIPCRLFTKSRGTCPNVPCFHLHAIPVNTKMNFNMNNTQPIISRLIGSGQISLFNTARSRDMIYYKFKENKHRAVFRSL